MARKKIKIVDKRKDNLDPDNDKFVNQTMSFMDWAYERRRPILTVLGVALLAAIAGISVDSFLDGKKAIASEILGEGLTAALAPVVPPSEDDTTPVPGENDEDLLTFETSRARATESLKRFETAVSKTTSEHELISRLGIAAAHLDLKEYDKAIAEYEKFLSSSGSLLDVVRPSAIEGLCYALEGAKRTDDAQTRLESLMKTSSVASANMARFHAARLAAGKNDSDKAIKLLKEIIENYTQENKFGRLDYLFVRARERLLALDPGADVPSLPTSGAGGFDFNNIDPRLLEQLRRANMGGGPN